VTGETILIVDDDPAIRFAFQKTFEKQKFKTICANDGEEAIKCVQEKNPAVIFMDIAMPGMDGLEALQHIKKISIDTPVIIITGHGNMQTAIQAMQLGAYDYLTKPLDVDKVRITANRAVELHFAQKKINELERKIEDGQTPQSTELTGKTQKMQEIYKKIGVISTTPVTTNVLILGETGTGKELVARIIHESGSNAADPFLAINCTLLPETLLESELFGHEKGAFTGADRRKSGKFEIAGNGTLLLDEIGDMPETLQKKLLRVIQERFFERLGGHEQIPLGARIIAATNRDLTKAIRQKSFREDLYYRLNVIEIILPPLRERIEDLPLLVKHFIKKYNKRLQKNISDISTEAMESLMQHDYAGNVRELENMIEHAMALERGGILTADSLPNSQDRQVDPERLNIPILDEAFTPAKEAIISAFEEKFIRNQLKITAGNVTKASKRSHIERQSFQRLMKKYNIRSEEYRTK
jgi:DNA-binding NtrC family response regulator